jgi:hypothetical protein
VKLSIYLPGDLWVNLLPVGVLERQPVESHDGMDESDHGCHNQSSSTGATGGGDGGTALTDWELNGSRGRVEAETKVGAATVDVVEATIAQRARSSAGQTSADHNVGCGRRLSPRSRLYRCAWPH